MRVIQNKRMWDILFALLWEKGVINSEESRAISEAIASNNEDEVMSVIKRILL